MRIGVIGAGAVGLACARELQAAGHDVVALEAADRPGTGITSRNSEVLHAGLHDPPGSAKASLCVEGAALLFAYMTRRGDGIRRCGKLVVASDEADVPRLEALDANGRACGVAGLELWDAARMRRREPAVRGQAALWSPETGILDAGALVRGLRSDFERAGGTLVLRAGVTAAERTRRGYRLAVGADLLECDAVVNAAGLQADRIARLPGPDPADDLPEHLYYKGSYVRVLWPSEAHAPPTCLVYPLPHRDRPGLGVHLTLDLGGGLKLGPDSERLPDRTERYEVEGSKIAAFEAAAREYLDLPRGVQLTADFAGIRPIRSDAGGSRDFYVAEESRRGLPRWINLLAIDSPGLTSCLAIGRRVGSLIA